MQVIIDELLINYEVMGTNSQSTIIILHGWKRSLEDWKFIAKSLSSSYKVVLIDLPGMGLSSMPAKTLSTYDYADIINSFVQKLDIKNFTLIGHSFGGKIATVLASKDTNIKKLILVDASGMNIKNLFVNLKISLSKTLKLFSFILPRHFLVSSDYKTAGPLLDTFKKVVGEYIEKDAQKIKTPTLIIWGDKDKEVNLNHAKKFKSLINGSKLRIVWGTGHDPFLEKPNKFLEILYEYI